MTRTPWLLFFFFLPGRSSGPRLRIWKKLRCAGAIPYQQSVFLLPSNALCQAAFRELEKDVKACNGKAEVSSIKLKSKEEQAEIISRFKDQADEDYGEFLGQCRGFQAELARERGDKHLTFAELENNEIELDNLRLWLRKIECRDFFTGAFRREARDTLKKCSLDFAHFNDEILKKMVAATSQLSRVVFPTMDAYRTSDQV